MSQQPKKENKPDKWSELEEKQAALLVQLEEEAKTFPKSEEKSEELSPFLQLAFETKRKQVEFLAKQLRESFIVKKSIPGDLDSREDNEQVSPYVIGGQIVTSCKGMAEGTLEKLGQDDSDAESSSSFGNKR